MIAALEDDQVEVEPAAPPRNNGVKLPEFWAHAPSLWFSRAEAVFALRHVDSERIKYCHVISALPHDVLRQVADLLNVQDLEQPYTTLKGRLMASHELTGPQRAEKVLAMPDLGGQKPSQLLAALLEWCPPGEEKTSFFIACFLRRLLATKDF